MKKDDIAMIQVIKILNRKFNIRLLDDKEMDHCWGQIKYIPNEIQLNNKLDDTDLKITILHEILHGIIYAFGYEKINPKEDFIHALSEGVYDFMIKNKGLIKQIIK